MNYPVNLKIIKASPVASLASMPRDKTGREHGQYPAVTMASLPELHAGNLIP